MTVYKNDAAFIQAMQKARASFSVFEAAFNSKDPKYLDLCIMIPFPVSENCDHLWLFEITKEEDGYYGVVDYAPDAAAEIKGKRMLIDREKMYDWFYIENGQIHGGYTMRVGRSRMSEEARILYNSTLPFVID